MINPQAKPATTILEATPSGSTVTGEPVKLNRPNLRLDKLNCECQKLRVG